MTSWNNVGVFGPDTDAILRELFTSFENNVTEGVVETDPPIVRLGRCADDRERKRRAKSLLLDLDAEVEAVVFLNNSDTGDWGTGYIYHTPDDRRDIALQEKIIGESGQKAYDVESTLRDKGYPVPKRHYTNRLEKEDYLHLYVDE